MPLSGDTKMHLVDNIDTAMEMKRWLGERRDVLGLDTETSGLDPYAPDAKLRLIQIGDHKTGWAIPFEGWSGVAIECLNAWNGPIALHNASFDVKWFQEHTDWKIPWHNLHDTMIMAQIARPGKPATLKGLSTQFVDRHADAGQQALTEAMKSHGWGWGDVPVNLESYWVYSALDPILTAHLWSHFRTDKAYPEVYDLEMDVLRITTQMEINGSRVDVDYCREREKLLLDYAQKNQEWALKNWGISIGSPMQLLKFFGDTLGAEFTRFTPGGSPSIDKEQLAIFENSNNPTIAKAARFILDTRRAVKFANSYFRNFAEMSQGGLLHPSIKTIQAITGRMSISSPALQQVPRGDASVRNAFIPRNEGELLISCDYSQVEMRLLAHFSKDPGLIQAFVDADATGGDFFTMLGAQIYDDPTFSKKDSRRGLVKNTLYGSAYGASPKKMAESAGIPLDVMEPIAQDVFRTYPGIKQFQRDTIAEGERRGKTEGESYVITRGGRKLSTDLGSEYKLTNYILQGSAGEVLKQAIVRLDNAGLTEYMMLPIHDEVVSSVPREDAEDFKKTCEEIMAVREGFAVPLLAEAEGGFERWGEKYDSH